MTMGLGKQKTPPIRRKGESVRGKCIVRLNSRATFIDSECDIMVIIHRLIITISILQVFVAVFVDRGIKFRRCLPELIHSKCDEVIPKCVFIIPECLF